MVRYMRSLLTSRKDRFEFLNGSRKRECHPIRVLDRTSHEYRVIGVEVDECKPRPDFANRVDPVEVYFLGTEFNFHRF